MITKAEIQRKITERAYGQFLRDISKVKALIVQSGGAISVYDAMERVREAEKREARQAKLSKFPFLKNLKKEQVDPEDYRFWDFALNLMSQLELVELTLADIESANLNQMYHVLYKREYEANELRMFNMLDMRYYKNPNVIKGAGAVLEDDAENC